jgi:hypothetical protein
MMKRVAIEPGKIWRGSGRVYISVAARKRGRRRGKGNATVASAGVG